jgi:hypothetical protein
VDLVPVGEESLIRAEGELSVTGLIRDEPHLAVDVADDEIEAAVAVPVDDGDGARIAGVDSSPVGADELRRRRELVLAEPAKE